ncbi:hypothetical protein ZWY2020_046272 [Hordeum vulgare]|nr:hypothetical protein ZWY2020_046272 [Hordeum vulgare]
MPSYIVPGVGGMGGLPAGVGVAGRTKAAEVLLTVFTVLGNCAAFILSLAPMMSFLKPIYKDKGTGDRTSYGHILNLFSSVAMFMYALPYYPDAVASLTINGASTLLQLIYVGSFLWFAAGTVRRHALYALAPILLASALLPCLVFANVVGTLFVSIIAAIAALLSYGSAIADMVETANLKLADNMDPLYEVLLGFVNAITSGFCGSLAAKPDLYMAVPNFVGAVILLAYVAVYIAHRQPPSAFHDDVRNFGFELRKMFDSPV